MEKGCILGYKIAYCLGASDKWLQRNYPILSKAAQDLGYFEDLTATQRMRHLNRVYYRMVREFPSFQSTPGWKQRVDALLWKEGLFSLDDIGVISSPDILGQLNAFNAQHNCLLSLVHNELEPGLSREDFILLLRREIKELKDVWEDNFFLKRLSWETGFVFDSAVLNFDMTTMLKKDSTLYSRIRVLRCGKTSVKVEDTSALATQIDTVIDSRFIKLEELCVFSNVFVLKGTEQERTLVSIATPFTAISENQWRGPAKERSWLYVKPDGQLTFDTLVEKFVDENRNLILELPVTPEEYRSVIRGNYPQIYFLSKGK